MDKKNPLQPIDINNHSRNEHVFGQNVGPAINIDLLKNKESTNNKHKPKSKSQKNDFCNKDFLQTFIKKHHKHSCTIQYRHR
jgi:hypothetical protein